MKTITVLKNQATLEQIQPTQIIKNVIVMVIAT